MVSPNDHVGSSFTRGIHVSIDMLGKGFGILQACMGFSKGIRLSEARVRLSDFYQLLHT